MNLRTLQADAGPCAGETGGFLVCFLQGGKYPKGGECGLEEPGDVVAGSKA